MKARMHIFSVGLLLFANCFSGVLSFSSCNSNRLKLGLAATSKVPANNRQLLMKNDFFEKIKKGAAASLFILSPFFFGIDPSVAAEVATDVIQPPSVAVKMESLTVKSIQYSEFLRRLENDDIKSVLIKTDASSLVATDVTGNKLKLEAIPQDPELPQLLHDHKVEVLAIEEEQALEMGTLEQIIPLVAVIFALGLLNNQNLVGAGGGGEGGARRRRAQDPFAMGQSRTEVLVDADTGVAFADVAGCDAAKRELEEVVDFLRRPGKYTALGARIPRGVIMQGPPGTGKTMLAKAVAGEAKCPFLSTSGSEFVEMFVGVGAARVRDLFAKAKENAPCIVFIDEIDAVGRQRGAGFAGGHDEREQTLNQILTELDGFQENPGVIVLAATNRPDILDKALLRPGRFDRKVTVELPDASGREQILRVHARGKPLSPAVDLAQIARRTPGFSGAGLQNLMNEAAIYAGRARRSIIEWKDVDAALDKLIMGLAKKSGGEAILERKEVVAFHEAGHALVGALIPDYDMVAKVSTVPRANGAGGVTHFAPNELRLESGLYTRQYLEAQLAVALGGRAAEELAFGPEEVTSGAANDLQQAARVAQRMVASYGFSDRLGPIAVATGEDDAGPFQGRDMYLGQSEGWGPETLEIVDKEVARLVQHAYVRARGLLARHRGLLGALAHRLLDQEVVTAEELSLMLAYDEQGVEMAPYGLYGDEDLSHLMPYSQQTFLPESLTAPRDEKKGLSAEEEQLYQDLLPSQGPVLMKTPSAPADGGVVMMEGDADIINLGCNENLCYVAFSKK